MIIVIVRLLGRSTICDCHDQGSPSHPYSVHHKSRNGDLDVKLFLVTTTTTTTASINQSIRWDIRQTISTQAAEDSLLIGVLRLGGHHDDSEVMMMVKMLMVVMVVRGDGCSDERCQSMAPLTSFPPGWLFWEIHVCWRLVIFISIIISLYQWSYYNKKMQ